MSKSKTALPKIAKKRLAPYIERGIVNGIFTDGKPVAEMYQRKANDPSLSQTISELGGATSEPAQQFITETGKIMSAKDTPYKGVRQHKSTSPKKSK